jgi:hypothetical protein
MHMHVYDHLHMKSIPEGDDDDGGDDDVDEEEGREGSC